MQTGTSNVYRTTDPQRPGRDPIHKGGQGSGYASHETGAARYANYHDGGTGSSKRMRRRKTTTRTNKVAKSARNDNGYTNDMIYFTLAIACDVEPREMISGISVEWMRAESIRLYRVEIQAFNTFSLFVIFYLYNNTFSPFVIFYLYNNTSVLTVKAEFKKIMEKSIKLLEEEGMTDEQERVTCVPEFAFRNSLPKLPGSDPEEYVGLKPRQTAARKAWHLEMETHHLHQFTKLIETCNEVRLFESILGGHVMISEVVDYNSPPGDIK